MVNKEMILSASQKFDPLPLEAIAYFVVILKANRKHRKTSIIGVCVGRPI